MKYEVFNKNFKIGTGFFTDEEKGKFTIVEDDSGIQHTMGLSDEDVKDLHSVDNNYTAKIGFFTPKYQNLSIKSTMGIKKPSVSKGAKETLKSEYGKKHPHALSVKDIDFDDKWYLIAEVHSPGGKRATKIIYKTVTGENESALLEKIKEFNHYIKEGKVEIFSMSEDSLNSEYGKGFAENKNNYAYNAVAFIESEYKKAKMEGKVIEISGPQNKVKLAVIEKINGAPEMKPVFRYEDELPVYYYSEDLSKWLNSNKISHNIYDSVDDFLGNNLIKGYDLKKFLTN